MSNLDEKLRSLQEQTANEQDQPKQPIKSVLASLNSELESASANLNKYQTQTQTTKRTTPNIEQHLKQLEETVNELAAKCARLSAQEEREQEAEMRRVEQLAASIDECNASVVKCSGEFDQRFGGSKLNGGSVAELQQFERERLAPVRGDLERLAKEYEACMSGGRIDPEHSTTLEIKFDKLNANVAKLEQKISDRAKG